MLKILMALCGVQTLLLVFFGVKLLEIDARTDAIAKAATAPRVIAAPSRTGAGEQSRDEDALAGTVFIGGLSAEEAREIIREEIAVLQTASAGGRYVGAGARPSAPSRSALTAPEQILLKNSVSKDLDYYISQGRIGAADMAQLQQDMAQLSTAERGALLSKMTRAMNEGKLQGEF